MRTSMTFCSHSSHAGARPAGGGARRRPGAAPVQVVLPPTARCYRSGADVPHAVFDVRNATPAAAVRGQGGRPRLPTCSSCS